MERLYVNTYAELVEFVSWMVRHYPELLARYLSYPLTERDFEESLLARGRLAKLIINLAGETDEINLSIEELGKALGVPIGVFPRKFLTLLKWRCPIPFIRKYLREECGIKDRKFYRLFWKL